MSRVDTLKAKYGEDYFRRLGAMGGRPHRLTYEEMQAKGLLPNIELQEERVTRFDSFKFVLNLIEEGQPIEAIKDIPKE